MRKLTSLFISIFFSFILYSGNSYSQITVSMGPTADNTLYEDASGTTSNGSGDYLFAGKTGSGLIRRGLISFKLDSLIPPCAIIQSCTLKLHMSRTAVGPKDVELKKVLSSWGESTSDPIGEEGSGAQAETGDATWKHRYFNTVFWTSDGGDFSQDPSAVTTVNATGFYTWGSTQEMIDDIQSWVDNPNSNYGWLLEGDEHSTPSAKRFDTKENDSVNFRPVLTVTYTLNIPALNLSSLIEGLWNGSMMVSDTARIYLRNASSPYAKVDSSTSLLNIAGKGLSCYDNAGSGNFFIVVTHRNSIDTWSAAGQTFAIGNLKVYNFTSSSSQAFGNNMILKAGKYCNYSGDVSRDGSVDLTDIVLVFNDAAIFAGGYLVTDLNGDTFVDLTDVVIAFNNSANFVTVISP